MQRQSTHRLLPLLVLAVAAACAVLLYVRFLESPRLLWNNVIHDRNAHLYSGLCLATDLRHADFGHLPSDLDAFRSWPPFHDGLLLGAILLLSGGDERFAVLPSLLGWVVGALFAFLLARRALHTGGSVAGMAAALYLLVSPAQRAYATDVMLESLGACLTLACLYYYVAAIQDRSSAGCRGLALMLTLLFFTKYNYYLLVVLGIAAHQIGADTKRLVELARKRLSNWDAKAFLGRRLREPGNYPVLLILTVCALIAIRGGVELHWFGGRISLRNSPNLPTIAYVACFIRLIPWYRRFARARLSSPGDAMGRSDQTDRPDRPDPREPATGAFRKHTAERILVGWHLWPMALWFLWPHRLYSFLWVNNPGSNAGEYPSHNLFSGYAAYWSCLAHDYHVDAWSAVTAIVLFLFAVGAAVHGKLRPGGAVVLWFIAVAFLPTVHHQNRKSRFLHTLVPVIWVGAGIGIGSLAPFRRARKSPAVALVYSLILGALTLPHLYGLLAPAHAPQGGIDPASPSALDITDAYLPDLRNSHHAAVFSNMPMKFLSQWTYMKRYGRSQRLETDISGFDPKSIDNRACLGSWLTATDCDTIVYAEFPPGTAFHRTIPGCDNLGQYGAMMESQKRFTLTQRLFFPRNGSTLSVWKRVSETEPTERR